MKGNAMCNRIDEFHKHMFEQKKQNPKRMYDEIVYKSLKTDKTKPYCFKDKRVIIRKLGK